MNLTELKAVLAAANWIVLSEWTEVNADTKKAELSRMIAFQPSTGMVRTFMQNRDSKGKIVVG